MSLQESKQHHLNSVQAANAMYNEIDLLTRQLREAENRYKRAQQTVKDYDDEWERQKQDNQGVNVISFSLMKAEVEKLRDFGKMKDEAKRRVEVQRDRALTDAKVANEWWDDSRMELERLVRENDALRAQNKLQAADNLRLVQSNNALIADLTKEKRKSHAAETLITEWAVKRDATTSW